MNSLTEYKIGARVVSFFLIISFIYSFFLYQRVYAMMDEINKTTASFEVKQF